MHNFWKMSWRVPSLICKKQVQGISLIEETKSKKKWITNSYSVFLKADVPNV